jgi:AmmeMemoRadiSam system protein B
VAFLVLGVEVDELSHRVRRRIMTISLGMLWGAFAAGARALAQIPPLKPADAEPARPTLEEVRRAMVVPSRDDIRGRIDSTGFALHAAQMANVWEVSGSPPDPGSLSPAPPPGVAAVICPHDDFIFAGRVYRRVLPLITARTVVLFGVFHSYRKFGEHDRMVFDPYHSWTAPDGQVPVSPLREAILARLPREDWTQDAAAHDAEHSIEPFVCWLRHIDPDLQIVPIIVPAARFERLEQLAQNLAVALAGEMNARSWELGRDVAIAISADAIHYGPDFKQTVFGEGGVSAYEQATAKDRGLLTGPMSGPLTVSGIRTLYSTFVDPEHPDDYRWTWCGRFSIPLGLLTLESLTRESGGVIGHPLVYGTSISEPELPLRNLGMSPTAPSNLYHFVGYPGAAFTTASTGPK